MDLAGLSRGERIVAGAGAALSLDLALLPWHRLNLGIIIVPRTALQWPNAPLGMAALLITLAIMITTVSGSGRRAKPVHRRRLQGAGLIVTGLLVAKLALSPDALGYAAYVGVALSALVAYGTSRLASQSSSPA